MIQCIIMTLLQKGDHCAAHAPDECMCTNTQCWCCFLKKKLACACAAGAGRGL